MERVLELIVAAQKGDAEAKEAILLENSGLIWSIVRRFRGRGYDLEDLYQIGSIGLLKCIDKFDLSYEVKFSTYAVPMILGEIKRFLRDDGMIKVSRPIKELASRAKYKREEFLQQTGRDATINELAECLQVSPEELAVALDAQKEVESIYSTVYQNDGGSDVYLLDKLEQKDSPDSQVIDSIALKQMLITLGQKERQIIFMRYFQDKTQSDIAKTLGISQVQVSRIEKKVLLELREKMSR